MRIPIYLNFLGMFGLVESQMCDYKRIEEGDLRVENDDRCALFELAYVKEISGRLIVRNNSHAVLSAPLLEHIHGAIEEHDNVWLQDIIFPRLVRFDARSICAINNFSYNPDTVYRQITRNQRCPASHASDEF